MTAVGDTTQVFIQEIYASNWDELEKVAIEVRCNLRPLDAPEILALITKPLMYKTPNSKTFADPMHPMHLHNKFQ